MAAQHAAHSQAQTAADAMRANGLLGIVGAGGHVAAAALHPEHDLQGRKDNAINADQKNGNRLHEPLSMAKFPKKATLLRMAVFSCGRQSYLLASTQLGNEARRKWKWISGRRQAPRAME
jgi:hypothetical protein